MKYRVVKCRNAHILQYEKNFYKRLDKFLNHGWKLQGELKVIVTNVDFINYYQVIIKEDQMVIPTLKNNCSNISIEDLKINSGIVDFS
jgi:hypothetical protein|tara:strand:+ start:600 stop:863 length:264 start_codon:yes stop_codon:yes gene_type:complete